MVLCGYLLLRVKKDLSKALSANTFLAAPRDDRVKLLRLILGETSPHISVIMESVVSKEVCSTAKSHFAPIIFLNYRMRLNFPQLSVYWFAHSVPIQRSAV